MSSDLGKEFMNDNKQWHGGKGDKPRTPNDETYRSNWDRIFGGIDYDTFWEHTCSNGKSNLLVKGVGCKDCGKVDERSGNRG